jgi:hypothetical protein
VWSAAVNPLAGSCCWRPEPGEPGLRDLICAALTCREVDTDRSRPWVVTRRIVVGVALPCFKFRFVSCPQMQGGGTKSRD